MQTRRFNIGERVIVRNSKDRLGARVTGVAHCKRRIVTDLGERRMVPIQKLSYPRNEAYLMLETRLDRNLRSHRGQGAFINELTAPYGTKFLYERIHTRDDLKRFLRSEGRKPHVRMIHFCGHGHGVRATIQLTFDEIKLDDLVPMCHGLKGKVLLFSSCEIGRLAKKMRTLVREAQLAGVIAYRAEVTDVFANLAEAMIYDRMILTSDTPRQIVAKVNKCLKVLGAKSEDPALRGGVLRCYAGASKP